MQFRVEAVVTLTPSGLVLTERVSQQYLLRADEKRQKLVPLSAWSWNFSLIQAEKSSPPSDWLGRVTSVRKHFQDAPACLCFPSLSTTEKGKKKDQPPTF